MAMDHSLLSTIHPGILMAVGMLMLATVGSTIGFAVSKERKQTWAKVTLVFAFLLLMVCAGFVSLALR